MTAADTNEPRQDWFLGAIKADGTVDDCLEAVRRELEAKSSFLIGLKQVMAPRRKGGLDAVSELAARIKALENTLRFRLGILRADRPVTWFRAPVTTTSGPFSSALLDEPVFAPYDSRDLERVKAALNHLWQERRADPCPFESEIPCLWRTLLTLNAELSTLTKLPAPYAYLSLESLPDDLPPILESRSLRAFLLNVRNEVLSARARLATCHRDLRTKSEELWVVQASVEPRLRRPQGQTQAHAESVREEMRRRRENRRLFMMNAADQRALSYLGFEQLPSADDLRRRYLELAKKLHPDRSGGDGDAFKELASAYSRLLARYEGAANS